MRLPAAVRLGLGFFLFLRRGKGAFIRIGVVVVGLLPSPNCYFPSRNLLVVWLRLQKRERRRSSVLSLPPNPFFFLLRDRAAATKGDKRRNSARRSRRRRPNSTFFTRQCQREEGGEGKSTAFFKVLLLSSSGFSLSATAGTLFGRNLYPLSTPSW